MTQQTLHFNSILEPGDTVQLARAVLGHQRPTTLHGHDFYELLWVQNGRVRHHLPHGKEMLSEGDLLFIRPQDRHGLQGNGEAPMAVSVTIHPDIITQLGARHPQLLGQMFWSKQAGIVQTHRDTRQMAELNHAALRLERSPRDSLAAEAFLLPLCAQMLSAGSQVAQKANPSSDATLPTDTADTHSAPEWLLRACEAARDPKVFRDGAAGFVRVAGRAHPHVSRTARQYLGLSPSDYVNTQRMIYAARALAGTGDTLAEIAADCGIPNLSHFHKLFRAHHGQTPQQFRRAHQRDVLQPG